MGEYIIELYKNKVKSNWKLAFWGAFIGCLVIHIYKFTNMLPNHDSILNLYSDQDMTMSGRWFLWIACGISSYFDLPWINGLLCAVYLGMTAVVIAELFNLKNPVVIVLSALILVSNVSTTETLFFEFTADGYLLGLLLAGIAALISCRGSNWCHYLISGLCLTLSCAIYQAYISFAVVLCICYLINQLLEGKVSVRESWKWIGKHIVIYGVAMATYYAIWKSILMITGTTATSYQGIDNVGQFGVSTLISGAVKSIKNVVLYFVEWNILEHPISMYAFLNLVFLGGAAFIIVTAVFKSGTYKRTKDVFMVAFCLVASVPMISIWSFLSEGVEYRPMMLHSLSFYYIYVIILFDRWAKPKISSAFGVLMVVIVFNFAVMDNISYLYMDKCYEKSYYMGAQILDRLEELDPEGEAEVIFVGNRKAHISISGASPGSSVHILTQLMDESDLLYDHEHASAYLNTTFNTNIAIWTDTVEFWSTHEEVEKMGVWPAKDSVKMIDGVIVVKLHDTSE